MLRVIALIALTVVAGCNRSPRRATGPDAATRAPAVATTVPPPPPRPATPPPPRGTWLAIAYSGNGSGELEPCG